MLKVCHVVSGDLWGGAEAQACGLIRHLSRIPGVGVSAVVFNGGLLAEKLTQAGIDVAVVPEKSLGLPALVRDTGREIGRRSVDLVHTHGFKETFVGGLAAAWCRRRKVVRTHHGRGVLESGPMHALIEGANAAFFTQRSIAVSQDLKGFLVSRGYREAAVTVVHNGIDSQEVRPLRTAAETRRELGIAADSFVVGTLGRLVEGKGMSCFLEGAGMIVRATDRAVAFIIAGDGPLLERLRSEASAAGLADRVKITGFRKDVFDVLNVCDIVSLLSLHEGVPMVLLEAMSLGKAIVATRVGGIPEIISHGENGLLVTPGDPAPFAEACLALMSDDALRARVGANALRSAAGGCRLEVAAQRVLQVYREVARR